MFNLKPTGSGGNAPGSQPQNANLQPSFNTGQQNQNKPAASFQAAITPPGFQK